MSWRDEHIAENYKILEIDFLQIWLYLIRMSRMHFKVIPHSIAVWMSMNPLLKTGVISEVLGDCNRNPPHSHLVRKQTLNHLDKLAKWLSCVVNLSARCIWLHFIRMSRTHFRVNPHAIVAWMSTNSFLNSSLKTSDIALFSSKEFFDIHATVACGFTLKCFRNTSQSNMILTAVYQR